MIWNKLGKGIQFTKILGETQARRHSIDFH